MKSYTSSKFRIFQIVSHVQPPIVPLLQTQSLDITSAFSNCNLVRFILIVYYAFLPFTSQTAFRQNCSAKSLNVIVFGKRGFAYRSACVEGGKSTPRHWWCCSASEQLRINFVQVNNNRAPMRNQIGVKDTKSNIWSCFGNCKDHLFVKTPAES
jgi:hypothetical protein